jgi:lysyl-tRNA synthetase class II
MDARIVAGRRVTEAAPGAHSRDRGAGIPALRQRFEFTHTIPQILAEYGAKTAEELAPEVRVRVAGRLMTIRHMGKAGFAHLQQNGERLQIYVKKDAVGERDFQLFKLLDIGDIIGVEGYLFRTRTGELSIHAEKLEFLSKTCSPCPRSGTAWKTWRRATASAISI